MDKQTFINSINYDDKDLLSNIFEKCMLFEKTGKEIFISEFLPPSIWKPLELMCKNAGISIHVSGYFEEAERRMVVFSDSEAVEFPFSLIEVRNKSKFKDLEHKDYLGSIMALGIKREKLGDLIARNDQCFLMVCNDIKEYILSNLLYVGNCPCIVKELNKGETRAANYEFKQLNILSTSNRIDCIVSAICGISRSKSVQFISGGNVLVNYIEVQKKDLIIDEGTTITIRGYGKYLIKSFDGYSKSQRIKMTIQKYI